MDRRNFLRSALYFTVASATLPLAACGGAADEMPAGTFSFLLGVASGDPKETSLVFWTRCCMCLAADKREAIPLRLEVSTLPAFDTLVATVLLTSTANFDFTVRAKVTNLLPGTRYFYRFVAGRDSSVTGEAQTAPPSHSAPARLRFAWLSCQDWSVNHWGALELVAAEELDFIVHVGNYIYEAVPSPFQPGRAEPAHGRINLPDGVAAGAAISADSLADYRTLYRAYRADPRLKELHRKLPFIATWDDHEFSDDCWQDHQTYTNENLRQTARRRNANQAWAEYMPVDWGDVSFDLANTAHDNIRIYRDFRFGTLMHLVMTDQRLFRDDHAVTESLKALSGNHDPLNGDDAIGARYLVPLRALFEFELRAALRLGRRPGILGSAQGQWWKDTLAASRASWKIWGNAVTLNRMWIEQPGGEPNASDRLLALDADAWDGYPSERDELMAFLRDQHIRNVVAISGDLNAFQCGTIRDNPDPQRGAPVAVDFVGAGVSSASLFEFFRQRDGAGALAPQLGAPHDFNELLLNNNPDLAFTEAGAQGYATATLTEGVLTVVFNKVRPLNADGSKPASLLERRITMTLASGSTAPVVVEDVGL